MDAKDIALPKGYSKQTGGAWRKGYAAYMNGKSKAFCPYGHSVMYTSRFNVYRSAWLDGWEKAKDESDHRRK